MVVVVVGGSGGGTVMEHQKKEKSYGLIVSIPINEIEPAAVS